MPDFTFDANTTLDQIQTAFQNSNATSIRGGGKTSLSAKTGATRWFNKQWDRLRGNENRNANRAEQALVAAYTKTTGAPPAQDALTKIQNVVRGTGQGTISDQLRQLKHAASDHKDVVDKARFLQETEQKVSNGGQNNKAQVLQGALKALQDEKNNDLVGQNVFNAVQKCDQLSDNEKAEVINAVAKQCSKQACLDSTDGGNMARHDDAYVKFLTTASQHAMKDLADDVKDYVTTNAHLSREELAEEALKKISGYQPSDRTKAYLTAVKEGAMEATNEKPELKNLVGKQDVFTPEDNGNKMVQSQITLRAVNPSYGTLGGNPTKASILVQTYDNFSGVENNGIEDSKPQNVPVLQMRQRNPQLLQNYRDLATNVTHPIVPQIHQNQGQGQNALQQGVNNPVPDLMEPQQNHLHRSGSVGDLLDHDHPKQGNVQALKERFEALSHDGQAPSLPERPKQSLPGKKKLGEELHMDKEHLHQPQQGHNVGHKSSPGSGGGLS